METFLQDLRVTLRGFGRSPGFPLTAVATLALGIGATTAIFTTLSAVLLKPLPYPHAEKLYNVHTAMTDGRVTTGNLSGGELYRLNDPRLSIERATGYVSADLTLMPTDGTPSHVIVYQVTDGFFEMFGLPMTTGGFASSDFTPFQPPAPDAPPQPRAPPRVVISTRLWQRLYNGDHNVVGKPIRFAEFSSTVAGVAPRDFDVPHAADVWLPQRLQTTDVNHGEEAYMRLKPGATIERANREMASVMAGLAADYPAADKNRIYVPKLLVASIVGDLGPILIIVMSATGLLLLLACVNVANLLLARGATRARELAVRAALGAGWGRLVRQLLTESLVLAAAGTIVGVIVGAVGLRALLALGAAKLPRLETVSFDARALLFSLAILIVTGVIIGLAPAARLLRTNVKTLMNDASRSSSAGRGTARWLMAMTVAEVALAIMLVAGAGWLVRGFSTLRHTDAGFVADERLIFDVSFSGARFQTPDAVSRAQLDLVAAVRGIHGVTGVGLVSSYPTRVRNENSLVAQFHGEAFDANNPPTTRQRVASAGLFAAMGTPLLEGRDFTNADLRSTVPVAIVNSTFVDRFLKGRDPIGVQFSAGYPAPDPKNEVTIVGVVGSVRQKSIAEAAEPAFYRPTTQFVPRRGTAVVSMAGSDPTAVGQAIRAKLREFDPTMAVEIESASDVIGDTMRRQELGMTLMLIFGGMAIVLAGVGIYGVISYAGSLRREEIATRLALGASPRDVFLLVMRQGATLGVAGAVLGVGLAYLSGELISNRVYAIRASDPVILAGAAVLIGAITLVATTVPATRASRLNPASALQSG